MTKNFAFVLVGFLLGAATTHVVYRSPETQAPLESTESQSFVLSTSPEARTVPVIASDPDRSGVVVGNRDDQDRSSAGPSQDGREFARDSAVAAQRLTQRDAAAPQRQNTVVSQTLEPSAAVPPSLPEEYRSLLAPPSPRRLRPDELFARFAAEARDEQWAYPMELGISQHIAAATVVGTVVESVECRSTTCIMAGYSLPGTGNEMGALFRGMAESGWWQASGATFMTAAEADGVSRFVTIVPRTEADAMQ